MINNNDFIKIIDIKNRTHIVNVNKIACFEEGVGGDSVLPYCNSLILDNGTTIYVYESFDKIMEQLSSHAVAKGVI